MYLACTTPLAAQVRLTKGSTPPSQPKENDWHLDTDDNNAYAYQLGKWESIVGGVAKADVMGDCFINIMLGHNGTSIVFGQTGKLIVFGDDVEVVDRILIKRYTGGLFVYDEHGEKISMILYSAMPTLELTLLSGQPGYCLPRYVEELHTFPWSNWHTWGFIGTDGIWHIEPKFDGPFKFTDGQAEVSYYGEKHRINEKGEWVE